MDQYVALDARTRGDLIVIPATFTFQDFDWTDVTARCYLRRSPNSSSYVVKFNMTGDATIGTDLLFMQSGTGVALFSAVASGSVTSTWPVGTLYGDIEVFREFPAWGPYTPVKFTLPILTDITY